MEKPKRGRPPKHGAAASGAERTRWARNRSRNGSAALALLAAEALDALWQANPNAVARIVGPGPRPDGADPADWALAHVHRLAPESPIKAALERILSAGRNRAQQLAALPEALAADARHGTVSTVSQTLTTAGGGRSVNSGPVILQPAPQAPQRRAAGFNGSAGEKAGGIGYEMEVASTVRAQPGGVGNSVVEWEE